MIYKLDLGRFRVAEIKQLPYENWSVTIELPNGIHANAKLPFKPKLQVGDLLTLYTEVYPDAQEAKSN